MKPAQTSIRENKLQILNSERIMRAIDFLKQQGFDVEPDIHTNLQRELHFTGNEIAYLMESYAMQLNGVSTSHDKALNLAVVSGSLPCEFLEWTEKHMWSKWESRNDGYHEMQGWYNTHNYDAMKQPLTTVELFDLFMSERRRQ